MPCRRQSLKVISQYCITREQTTKITLYLRKIVFLWKYNSMIQIVDCNVIRLSRFLNPIIWIVDHGSIPVITFLLSNICLVVPEKLVDMNIAGEHKKIQTAHTVEYKLVKWKESSSSIQETESISFVHNCVRFSNIFFRNK